MPDRIEVNPLEIPWDPQEDQESTDDPIPAHIRDRFRPDNKLNRSRNPVFASVPLHAIRPGEDLLWGSVEDELVNRLRTGIITSLRAEGDLIVCKVESVDGVVDRAYLRFGDHMAKGCEPYQDVYQTSSESLVRSAAAAYELAKACGLDDIVAPTVYRTDEHDGLEPVLSIAARDMLAATLGCPAETLQKAIGRNASLMLWSDGQRHLVEDVWFQGLVSGESSKNNILSDCPYAGELLRGAVFDFISWNGNRTFADVLLCDNERHRIHLMNNELSFPDPIAIGTATLDYSEYGAGCPEAIYAPLLWSDLVATAALRGYEHEARLYEEIAQAVCRSLSRDMQRQLVRSLNDHGVSPLAMAGMLVRVNFLKYGFDKVMRDPITVGRYYSSILTGEEYVHEFDIDIESMEQDISAIISDAVHLDFDFRAAMQEDV